MFSSRSFTISSLAFKSLVHLEKGKSYEELLNGGKKANHQITRLSILFFIKIKN